MLPNSRNGLSVLIHDGPACRVVQASGLGPRNSSCREGQPDSDTVSSTTWIPKRTITVEGDGAVLSSAHRDLGRDFVDLEYIEVIRNIQFVSLVDFSGFLCKVVTRQKLKLTRGLSFPLVVCCNFALLPLPHAKEKLPYGF